MDNNSKGKLIIVNISEIIHELMRKVWLMIIIGVALAAVGMMYANMQKGPEVPMYKATTKMYMASNASTFGQTSIPNYLEMVKSRKVLENVIEKLGLNMSYAELSGCISSSSPSGTSMLYLSVVFPDPEWAKKITDELVVASASYALEIIGSTPPIVYEEAYASGYAYNTFYVSATKYALIGGVAGVILGCGLILTLYFLKDRFDTPSKVEDRARIKLLAFVAREGKRKKEPNEEQACRCLINNLYTNGSKERLIAFASTSDKEGRSEMASAFADSLTSFGKNVLLLDLTTEASESKDAKDRRREVINYLKGESTIDELIEKSETTADKIYGGSDYGIVCELYTNDKFDELLQWCKTAYDYVLVNIPALENHAESDIIAKNIECVVLVLSAKKSSVLQTKKVVKQLLDGSVKVIGAVLGDVNVQKNRYFKRVYKKYLES